MSNLLFTRFSEDALKSFVVYASVYVDELKVLRHYCLYDLVILLVGTKSLMGRLLEAVETAFLKSQPCR